eukprot:520524-Rhodomonas_salina.1
MRDCGRGKGDQQLSSCISASGKVRGPISMSVSWSTVKRGSWSKVKGKKETYAFAAEMLLWSCYSIGITTAMSWRVSTGSSMSLRGSVVAASQYLYRYEHTRRRIGRVPVPVIARAGTEIALTKAQYTAMRVVQKGSTREA